MEGIFPPGMVISPGFYSNWNHITGSSNHGGQQIFIPLIRLPHLEIIFTEEEDGTLLTLNHTEIPFGQGHQYEIGWIEYYFEPMLGYFTYLANET